MYDIIIIGGGISGLYTAYKISKSAKYAHTRITLLEKEEYLGGRVFTYHDKYMDVEAGAGRFRNKHKLLLGLLRELNLEDKIQNITGKSYYAPNDHTDSIYENENYVLIDRIIKKSKLEKREVLQNLSFIDYSSQFLSHQEVEYIQQSFGYHSELVVMNAYDAIHLLEDISPKNKFHSLKGGLSQMIDKLVEHLNANENITIVTNKAVASVKHIGGIFEIMTENQTKYTCNKVVCTLPSIVMKKIKLGAGFPTEQRKTFRESLDKIYCGSLCRIYSNFDDVWFKGLPKMTTNNNLRMIIPYNEKKGTIMISYSDNKYADYWSALYNKKGIEHVNREIQRYIHQSLGISIPKPKHTKIFYWKCGVGYWTIGANSAEISRYIIRPFVDIDFFVCGENYSENQQWIEGALETSNHVLSLL